MWKVLRISFLFFAALIHSVCEAQESNDQPPEILLSKKISENLPSSECRSASSGKGELDAHDECPSHTEEIGEISLEESSLDGSSHENHGMDTRINPDGTAALKQVDEEAQSNKNDRGGNSENAQRLPSGHLKKLGEHGSEIIVGEIEELDYVPHGKDFYEHFLRKRRPLILRGALKDWPAVQHWPNETYLREKHGATIFDVQFSKKYEGEFPVKKTMNLTEYLNIYKTKDVYLDCPFVHTSGMMNDILIPHCLQCEEIARSIGSVHLLFSSGNTSSSCHFDGYENLLSVIAGTKDVLVADSKYVELFYPESHTTVNIESPIDPEAVDLERFPRVAEIPFHRVSELSLSSWLVHDSFDFHQQLFYHSNSYDGPRVDSASPFSLGKCSS